jgi:hypothetical protein
MNKKELKDKLQIFFWFILFICNFYLAIRGGDYVVEEANRNGSIIVGIIAFIVILLTAGFMLVSIATFFQLKEEQEN